MSAGSYSPAPSYSPKPYGYGSAPSPAPYYGAHSNSVCRAHTGVLDTTGRLSIKPDSFSDEHILCLLLPCETYAYPGGVEAGLIALCNECRQLLSSSRLQPQAVRVWIGTLASTLLWCALRLRLPSTQWSA